MSSTDANTLKFMSGSPAMYKDICLVRSPFLKQIAAEGLDRFYQYISVLQAKKPTGESEEIAKLLSPLSDFEYLLLLTQMEKEANKIIKAAFKFFTEDSVTFVMDPPSIVMGDPSEKRILTKDTYAGFLDLVSHACAMKDLSEDTIEFLDSDTPRVRALKEKMLQGRRQREEAKRKNKKSGEKSLELSDLIASLTIGSNAYNMLNVWDLTYYAFQDQLKRMSWREEFDINTRASLAGAKLDKNKLSHWIKTMSFD